MILVHTHILCWFICFPGVYNLLGFSHQFLLLFFTTLGL
jgi:hypothetical protein